MPPHLALSLCQGPLLLGTCPPRPVVVEGHIYPTLVPSSLEGLLCVPLGTGTTLSLLGMGTAQCPCVSTVPPLGTEVTLCPQWAGDSWNGCVTPWSVTLLVALSPPLPTGRFCWCWGTDGHSRDTESPWASSMGSLMSPHPALTQEGINSSSITSCHMPGAGRSPAPSWGHSCSWGREGWPGGHLIPPALPPQGPPHRPGTVPGGHPGFQAVPVGALGTQI